VWLAFGVAIAGALAAPMIISILYGPAFADSSRILAIHVWAGVLVAAAVLRGRWVVAMKLHRIAFLTVLVGATLNVVGNALLIPALGPTGAAWSTLGARLLSFYLGAVLFGEIRVTIRYFHRALLWPFTALSQRMT
jgi:PST family polysaccharide transporter